MATSLIIRVTRLNKKLLGLKKTYERGGGKFRGGIYLF